MNRSGPEQGFALVETVIALAIIALMLGITFQTIGRAQRVAADTEIRRLAMLEARSVLAQVGATIPLVPGSERGSSGVWNWRVEIAPETSDHPGQDISINRVTIFVRSSDLRGSARLDTLRLAR